MLLRLRPAAPAVPRRCAGALDFEFLGLGLARKFASTVLEPGALLLELDLLGGKFFEPDDVPLLWQIEGVDFVADAGELLGRP